MNQQLARVSRRALSTSAPRFNSPSRNAPRDAFSGGPEKAPSGNSPPKGGPDNVPGSQNKKADSAKAANSKMQTAAVGMGVVIAGYYAFTLGVAKKRDGEEKAGNVPAWQNQTKDAKTN